MVTLVYLLPVLVALAALTAMADDLVYTVLPSPALAPDLVAVATGAAAQVPAATTLRAHTVQHIVSSARDAGVHTAAHGRARLSVVGRRLLAPLASTDVRGVHTL